MATSSGDSEGELPTMQVDSTSERRLTREQPTTAMVVEGGKEVAMSSASMTAYDRKKSCPMYIRLFCRLNGHHRPEEFAPLSLTQRHGAGLPNRSHAGAPHQVPTLGSTELPAILSDEVVIYTWWDATLRELADLLREVNEECRTPTAYFSFALIWGDLNGRTQIKPLGGVGGTMRRGEGTHHHRALPPPSNRERTLRELRFLQGDFIDVAIYPQGRPPSSHPSLSASLAGAGDQFSRPDRRTDRHQGWRDQRYGRTSVHLRGGDDYGRGRDTYGRQQHQLPQQQQHHHHHHRSSHYYHDRNQSVREHDSPGSHRSRHHDHQYDSRRSQSPPADRHHHYQHHHAHHYRRSHS